MSGVPCFKDHPYDKQTLGTHAIPLRDCPKTQVTHGSSTIDSYEVRLLTPECLWRAYQKEAEDIVAPGGKLIADPLLRNKAINAAYARLWLNDNRFQWAGLAAFASKQVGCGLVHAREGEKNANTVKKGALGFLFRQPWVTVVVGGGAAAAEREYRYMLERLAFGNTSLFLDVFPLHAFYKKRGWKEFEQCLPARKNIYGNPQFPILWPPGDKLTFGEKFPEILQAFEAIEAGDIPESVKFLARHEQVNILQPLMYEDMEFQALLRANQAVVATNIPNGLVQSVELTLSNQCRPLNDERTVGFNDSATANLADVEERMAFVLRAAKQFDALLRQPPHRAQIQEGLQEIARGIGVRR
jgi:hypothetical protein